MFPFFKNWPETTVAFHEGQPLRDENALGQYRLDHLLRRGRTPSPMKSWRSQLLAAPPSEVPNPRELSHAPFSSLKDSLESVRVQTACPVILFLRVSLVGVGPPSARKGSCEGRTLGVVGEVRKE